MGKINKGRVLLGGLLAGLGLTIIQMLVNQAILGEQWSEARTALNLQWPLAGGDIVVGVVKFFLIGIFIVWLYAAIRPRYGAGPKTAVLAGIAVWFICALLCWGCNVYTMFPCGLVVTTVVICLVVWVLAALAGGWVYKENEIG